MSTTPLTIGHWIRFYHEGSYFNGILTATLPGLDRGSHVRICVPSERVTIAVPIRTCEPLNCRAREEELLGFSSTLVTGSRYFEGVIASLLWIDDTPYTIVVDQKNARHSGLVELSSVEVGVRYT